MKEEKSKKEHFSDLPPSQTGLLCMMGMIHSVSPNAKENSPMQSEMKMGCHEVAEQHFSQCG